MHKEAYRTPNRDGEQKSREKQQKRKPN